MNIILLDGYETDVIQYDINHFKNLPFDFIEREKELISTCGDVNRIYELEDGRLIFEYLNRQCLEFESTEVYSRLKKSNVIFSSLHNHKFTYSFRIDKVDFDKMKIGAKEIKTPSTLSWFGNYYELEHQQVLMEWLQPERCVYTILENIYWMLSFDYELEPVFKEWIGLDNIMAIRYSNEIDCSRARMYQLRIEDGVLMNSNEAKDILGEMLNLNINELDHSENSVDLLFNSFWMNWSNLFHDHLVNPIVAYLGEIFTRIYSVKWLERDSNYFLVSQGDLEVNITEEVEYELIDRECFLIENVYNSIRKKIKAQNNAAASMPPRR